MTHRDLGRSARRLVVGLVAGYLLGTVSTADIVAKRRGGTDLRSQGSGNPGAANAMSVLGTRDGLVVMAGDIGKGVGACALGGLLAGPAGAHLAGTAAVAGHCYPITRRFRGGKGVAASVGQCLATFPAYVPIDLAVAAATASVPAWKRRAFAATMVSSVCWVIGATVWWAKGWRNLWGPEPTVLLPVSALLSSLIIAERFRAAADRPPATPGASDASGAIVASVGPSHAAVGGGGA